MTDNIVERVARIVEPHGNWDRSMGDDSAYQHSRQIALAKARAAIAALREPSEAMIEAGAEAELNMAEDVGRCPAIRVWYRMIDAAIDTALTEGTEHVPG